jgi:hypothetical protein
MADPVFVLLANPLATSVIAAPLDAPTSTGYDVAPRSNSHLSCLCSSRRSYAGDGPLQPGHRRCVARYGAAASAGLGARVPDAGQPARPPVVCKL